MWNYEKRLQFPIHIKNPNPALAAMIISQYGGPDGESSASMRYLSQRYSMPYREVSGLLTDIATEELSHLEMVSVMVHQLTRNLSVDQIKGTPFEAYYVDHTTGIWPQAAGGIPFNACEFQSKGDAITDLVEDLAAEQKARSTYDNLIRLTDDADVLEPLRFLRQREMPLIPILIKNVNSICAYSMIQSKSLEGAAAKSAGGPVCYAGSIHKKEYKNERKDIYDSR